MQEAKKNLRLRIKQKLRDLNFEEKKKRDDSVVEQMNQFFHSHIIPSNHQSLTVGVFYPLNDEVYWPSGFLDTLRLAFPEVDGRNMFFRQCGLEELVEIKQFGQQMRVPGQGSPKVKPDIIIVPGIAFDESGNRLGRGGGFYDSYLRHFKGTKMGICKDMQLVDELPIEGHDVKVDFVCTESKIISCTS